MENKPPIICALGISYAYLAEETGERFPVIKNISFEVCPREFVSLVGPSGCGKSTLLKILAGLIKTKHGSVISQSQKTSMVFQNFAIFPWLTVKNNVEYGLKMEGVAGAKRKEMALAKIKEVGLAGSENQYPRKLSGGMQQRVGVARALAIEPDLLLMDEPFSSLDVLTAEKLRSELLDLCLKYKMTIIMVTHQVEEAVEMSDRIIVLGPRPTTVKEIIEVNLPRPRDKRSKEYYKLVDKITKIIESQ